ncbi:MAG: dihydroorotase family protein [Patescibacteria group bacterium]|jgi:dihydroorotase
MIISGATHWKTGMQVDLFIHDGRIVEKQTNNTTEETLDARGLIAFPGFIDAHVHLREPGNSEKETWTTGTRAAARGGYTAVFDMPNTNPPLTSKTLLEEKRILSRHSLVNYGLHFALTAENLSELERIKPRSVKIFLGRSTGNLFVDDALLQKAFERLPGTLFLFHAEAEACLKRFEGQYAGADDPAIHSAIRDRSCALEAIERVLELLRKHPRPVYFCHISTKEEVALIKKAKADGLPVYAEVTPHHVFLDESAYATLGTLAKVNPPLRTAEDRAALLEAINDGTIDVLGTDHAPHLLQEKKLPYPEAPAGMPGLETAAALLFHAAKNDLITHEIIGRIMSARPAEILGLRQKGDISVGKDADITLVDPSLSQRVCHEDLQTKCRWSPWHGITLTGWPVTTIVAGVIVFHKGTFYPHQGKELYYA